MMAKRLCILSLIVMFAFVIVMTIVLGTTQNIAYADDIITQVELTIDTPVNGETTYWAHITDDSENRYYVRFTNWFDITADKDLTSSSDKFVGGHSYRVSITVCVMPSLYPATQFLVSGLGNPDVTAKVNNKIAATRKSYSNDAKQMFVIDYEFASTEYSQVTKVSLNGLDAPAASQNPDFDIEIAEGECHANTNMGSKNGIVWYDPMANSIVAENNTFDLGKEYETQINLEVDEGFYFGSGLEVYLNGEKLSLSSYSYINQFLTITKSYTCEKAKIKTVAITGLEEPTWESGNPGTTDYEVVIEDEHYNIVPDAQQVYADAKMHNGVKWIDLDSDIELDVPSDYEAGKTYKAVIYLKPEANYEFAMNGGLTAVSVTVNGNVADCHPIFSYGGEYGDYLAVEYIFAPTSNIINNIYLNGFVVPENTEPAGAQNADQVATGAGYNLYELTWYDENRQGNYKGNFEYGDGSNKYYALLSFETIDAYEFGTYELYINGVHIDKAGIIEQFTSDTMLNLYVPFLCEEKSVDEVFVSLIEPATGEMPSNELVSGEATKYSGISTYWYLDSDYSTSPVSTAFENGVYGAKMQIASIEGYRFAEHVKVHVNNSIYFYADSESSATLVAKWPFQSAPAYTITFNANEGSGDMDPLTFVKDFAVIKLPECGFTAPTEKHFVGWSESSNGTIVDNPYTFTYGNNLTLYAIWEEYHEYDIIEINTHALVGATTAVLLSNTDIASGSVTVVKNGWETEDGDPIVEGASIDIDDTLVYIISFIEKAEDHMFFPEGFSYADAWDLVQITGDARYYSDGRSYDSLNRIITVKLYFYCDEAGILSDKVNVKFYNEDKSQSVSWILNYGDNITMPNIGEEPGEVNIALSDNQVFTGWENDSFVYPVGYQSKVWGDIELTANIKNIYKITLNFGDYGNDIVFDMIGQQTWWTFEWSEISDNDNVANLMKVGNKYLVGFAKEPVAENADFATRRQKILYDEVIDETCTLYAVYTTLPDPIFDVTKPSDKILSSNGNIQELGKLTIDSYPYYYWLNEDSYYTLNVEFEGGQLVGTNDNNDKLDFEVYSYVVEDYAITINGQKNIILSSNNNSLDKFGTIAGNKQFVYIDGYGTDEDFAAVGSVVNGKIALVNRGGITFSEKATNADAAGAIGLLIVNNTDNNLYPTTDAYTGTIPCGTIYKSVGDLLKSGEKKISSGVEYYDGSLTISTEEEKFYFNQSYGYYNRDLFVNQDSNKNDVWVKILDPSKIKDGETYTGNVTYKFTIKDASDDEVGTFTKTTKLTVGEGAPVEPSVQPDPNYPHTTIDGKEVYAQDITLATNENVSVAFASAKAGHGIVKITVDMMGLSILFDENAVNAIGGKDVMLNANFITPPFNAPYTNIEGLDSVFELTLIGATFANGTATVTVHREIEVPDGKAVKVYYLNGGNRTGCTTSYQDNEITFTTNHFSSFITVVEDAQPEPQPVNPDQPAVQPAKKGLSGGAIAGIVIAIVVALGAAGFCVYWFVFRKKKGNTPKVEEKKEDESQEETKEEPQEEEKVEEQPEEQKTEENVEDKPTDEE